IFDLDGVLVDSEGIGFETLRAHLRIYGVEYRVEDNEPFIGINDRDHFAALKAQHGLPASVDELIAEQTARLLAQIETGTVPMPGRPDRRPVAPRRRARRREATDSPGPRAALTRVARRARRRRARTSSRYPCASARG